MIYLNENFEGGDTVFLIKDEEKKYVEIERIKPKMGQAIIFSHNMWHEGEKVNGLKYMIRSDIIYERENYTGSNDWINSKEYQTVVSHFDKAAELECFGKIDEATKEYEEAIKLTIEHEMTVKLKEN